MNRADAARMVVLLEEALRELREGMTADAKAEYLEQGTAPTWRMPGITVTTAITHPSVRVADDKALLAYVARRYPTEVETIRRVRGAFLADLLARLAQAGEPLADDEGTVIPGLEYVAGGEFRAISVRVEPGLRARLRGEVRTALEAGVPLALPGGPE